MEGKTTRPINLSYHDIYLGGFRLTKYDIEIVSPFTFVIKNLKKFDNLDYIEIYEKTHTPDNFVKFDYDEQSNYIMDQLLHQDEKFYEKITDALETFTPSGNTSDMDDLVDWFYAFFNEFLPYHYINGDVRFDLERYFHIFDEKTRSITNLQKQRRRWLHSQYALIVNAIAEFPYAKFKAGYADKLLQWLFIPRILLITGLPLLAILSIFTSSIWWLYLLATIMLFAAICLGLPAGVKIKDLAPVLNQVPAMALATLRNIFGKKTASDEFIHTDHENSN